MATPVSFTEQDFPPRDLEENHIVDIYARDSSWMWVSEPGFEPPQAPEDEQRAFRRSFSLSQEVNRGKLPVNATIIVAVDNYFSLYINGAPIREANPQDAWEDPWAFSVPLAPDLDEVVFAIRAVNARAPPSPIGNPAGVRAAVGIAYQDGSNDFFYTGQGQGWVAERLIPEGWEKKNFNDSTWREPIIWPERFQSTTWRQGRGVRRVWVADALPSVTVGGTAPPVNWTPVSTPPPVEDGRLSLAPGLLAGLVVGVALVSTLVTALGMWLVSRSRGRFGRGVKVQVM